MSTYIAAPNTTANNTNQKAAQSAATIPVILVLPLAAAAKAAPNTTANNTNQKAAQSAATIPVTLIPSLGFSCKGVPSGRPARALSSVVLTMAYLTIAAPKPTAVNTGGGQAGYAG